MHDRGKQNILLLTVNVKGLILMENWYYLYRI